MSELARGASPAPAGASTRASSAPQQGAPGAHWQRAQAVQWFLDQRQARLPLIDVQEELVAKLFQRHGCAVQRFLDLGAGDGALSQLMLSLFPRAEAVLVDFSEPMLAAVQRRLHGRGAWRIVRGDLSQPGWREGLPAGSYDAAVSALAIHHLPAQRKRELYGEVLALLAPGAMFVNMDYVSVAGPLRGLWDEQLVANAVCLERQRGGTRSEAQLERDLCDDADEDRPDSVEQQLQWLRELGFADVEVHFKWAEAAVFGGVKPSHAAAAPTS